VTLDFYLPATGGKWKRRGHADVLPGSKPTDPAPPTSLTKVQIVRTQATSASSTPAPDPTPTPTPTPTTTTFGVGINDQQQTGLESAAGVTLGFHRTYHGWSDMTSAIVSQCASDKTAGRVPVVSVKLPATGTADQTASWDNCATGDYDAQITSTVNALVNLNIRVILAFHHEPEGDGALSTWRAMQAHLVPLVNRGKVELWAGFTGYHQLYGTSEWKLAAVTVPGIKGHGYDPYQSYLASSTSWTDHDASYYTKYRDHARTAGIKWGIWETGINEQAAASGYAKTLKWCQDRAAACKALEGDHWIYWDNIVNTDGSHDWRLTTTGPANKRAQFIATMKLYA
jgi:hypothetical protein